MNNKLNKDKKNSIANKNKGLRNFYILWSTQSLSQLGSAMTSFALTLWVYDETGLSMNMASLMICSYAPYVLMSILAGASTDKFDKKKTMLIADLMAAISTAIVFILFKMNSLSVWHLYLINIFTGLMNTVQQPASEVAYTLIIPKEYYHKTGVLQSFSRSMIQIGHSILAAAIYGLAGLDAVIIIDLVSFAIAFISLLGFVKVPKLESKEKGESVIHMAKEGLAYLKNCPLILYVILYMAGVNLIASIYETAIRAMILPNPRGGDFVMGIVTACSGVAMVIGSFIATAMPKPKDRVRTIYLSMLFSLGTENFILAFSRNPVLWCIAQIIGWIVVPVMSTNQNVIMRNTIPEELQGRVYACRNTLQFFTIPVGYFLGGFLVDKVTEPFMATRTGIWNVLFGSGKGSGAALTLLFLGVAGTVMCLIFGKILKKYKYTDD